METSEVSTKDIINNLYVIRAGLSTISELSNEYKRRRNLLDDWLSGINADYQQMKNASDEISQKESEIRGYEVENEDLKKKAKTLTLLKEAASGEKFLTARMIFSFLLIVGSIIALLVGGLFAFSILVPAIIWNVVCIIKFIDAFGAERYAVKDKIGGNERRIADKRKGIIELQNRIEESRYSLAFKVRQYNTMIQNKESLNTFVTKANALYAALEEAYADICHPDNWKNIDRIVYYLSTGRADNLRDALNLMDQRLNAELIANEIRASSEMIAGELHKIRQEVISAVNNAAERINNGICSLGRALSESNAAVLASTERLVTAQELNNSLQRQANKTCEQLLRDYQVVDNRVHY